MNTPSSIPDKSTIGINTSHMMRFGQHQVHHWAVYLTLTVMTAVLFIIFSTLGTPDHSEPQPAVVAPVQELQTPVLVTEMHEETDILINKLKEFGLWTLPSSGTVPPFLITSYPTDLNSVDDIIIKKRVFLHSLLPHALLVRQETLHKRERLESILSKIDCSPENINFTPGSARKDQCSWAAYLSKDEVSFVQGLCKKYRTTSASGLLDRVDSVPTSIILAQGALESSWGSSRFTREGNSIFGMWTWKTKGMVPSRRETGKTHKVKAYANVLDSVRAYHLTLNRLGPYDRFRQLRKHTDNPLIMAQGLSLYSERGKEYVEDIKNVILSNDLQKFDNYTLSDSDITEFSGPVSNSIVPDGPRKASL